MPKTTVEWHADELVQKIETEMGKRLYKAGAFLANEVKKKLGDKYPPPADNNTPPHLRTGTLRRSITHTVDEVKMIGRVGTNLKYGAYLEKGDDDFKFPYLEPTLEENKATVGRILAGKKIL